MNFRKLLSLLCAVLMALSLCACDVEDVLDSIKGLLDGDDNGGEVVLRPEVVPNGDGGNAIVGAPDNFETVGFSAAFRVYVNDGRVLSADDFPEMDVVYISEVRDETDAFDVVFCLNVEDRSEVDAASSALRSRLEALSFVKKLVASTGLLGMVGGTGGIPASSCKVHITVKDGYDAASLTAADFPGITVENVLFKGENVIELTLGENVSLNGLEFDQPFVESVQIVMSVTSPGIVFPEVTE